MNATATKTQEITENDLLAVEGVMYVANEILKNRVAAGIVEDTRDAKIAAYEQILRAVALELN